MPPGKPRNRYVKQMQIDHGTASGCNEMCMGPRPVSCGHALGHGPEAIPQNSRRPR